MSRSDEVRDIINNILINVRKRAGNAENVEDAKKSYEDEPILRRASDLFLTPQKASEKEVPEKIRELRQIETAFENRLLNDTALFCKEARFMADYEDDSCIPDNFFCYYPTYRQMSNDELRGYFSMRTKIRHGDYPEHPPLSFLFVYIYEQINLIGPAGAETPAEAFDNLRRVYEIYGSKERRVGRYLNVWLVDFVLYYDLDDSYFAALPALKERELLAALKFYKEAEDAALFEALAAFSTYRLDRSAFVRQNEELFAGAAVKLYKKISAHAEKSCKYDYFTRCFGQPHTSAYAVFSTALFAGKKHADMDRNIDQMTHFSCRNGHFSRTGYPEYLPKSAEIGEALHALDAVFRKKVGFPAPIKDVTVTKTLGRMIEEAILETENERKEAKKRHISLDFASLDGIRSDADLTRDRLLTEEERAVDSDPTGPTCSTGSTCAARADFSAPYGAEKGDVSEESAGPRGKNSPLDVLSAPAKEYLRNVASGEPGEPAARAAHTMGSVLAEEINDKLYDIFGDTVIVFDGDDAQVVPDYLEELKGMFDL